MRMLVRLVLIVFSVILVSCGGSEIDVQLRTEKIVSKKAVVSNVQVVDNQLIIDGVDLASVESVKLETSSGVIKDFIIDSKTPNQILASGLTNIQLAVGSVMNLVIADAHGASSTAMTISLANGSITARMLSDMGAADGDVLVYDQAGEVWEPRALSGLNLVGSWDANINSPSLADGGANTSPLAGDYYIVGIAGTTLIDTEASWNPGDWIIFNGSTWDKITNTSDVASFNGRQGVVSPQANDYTWNQIDKTLSPIGDLSNVDTSGAVNGSVLKFDGANWVVGVDNAGAGSSDTITSTTNTIITADTDANNSGDIVFQTAGSTKATLSNDGDLNLGSTVQSGVGTTVLSVGSTNEPTVISLGEDTDNKSNITWDNTNNYVSIGTRSASTDYTDTLVVKDGNVGIGTATPSSRLDLGSIVSGVSDVYNLTTDLSGGAIGVESASIYNQVRDTNGSSGTLSAVVNDIGGTSGGRVNGVWNKLSSSAIISVRGIFNSGTLLDGTGYGMRTVLSTYNDATSESIYGSFFDATTYNSSDRAYGNFVQSNAASTGGIQYGTYVDLSAGAATKYPAIFLGGNVGIGTINPTGLLDISSSDTSGTNLNIINSGTGGDSSAQLRVTSDSSSGFFGAFDDGHSVPAWRDRAMFGANSAASGITISAHNSGQDIRFTTNSLTDERMRISSAGNVGIGTINPDDVLDVVGDVDTTGCFQTGNTTNVGGTCVSDKRLKKDIKNVNNSLKRILGLRPVQYVWRPEFIDVHNKEGREFGLIAQEVEEVFPELVVTKEDGYKRVKYDVSFTLHIINSIKEFFGIYEKEQKEQNDLISKQGRKIASLEEENAEIKAKNVEIQNELKGLRLMIQNLSEKVN